ncbi:MAG: hypothetical protein ABJB98_05890 [Actinomycetota bacterium]
MTLSSQHLSDEAIAAYADCVLAAPGRARARRHLAACADCAHAVTVQREAVWALRAAPAPALPSGLLDRLRAVPDTTPLYQLPMALAPDGAPVFAAFRTTAPSPGAQRRTMTAPAVLRHPGLGLFAAAAAVVGIAAVGAGLASAVTVKESNVPVAPARIVPAGFTTSQVNGPVTVHVDPALIVDLASFPAR